MTEPYRDSRDSQIEVLKQENAVLLQKLQESERARLQHLPDLPAATPFDPFADDRMRAHLRNVKIGTYLAIACCVLSGILRVIVALKQ